MQFLTEKNTALSQELERCKAQLEAALTAVGESKKTPAGKQYIKILVFRGFKCQPDEWYSRWRRTQSGQATASTPVEGW